MPNELIGAGGIRNKTFQTRFSLGKSGVKKTGSATYLVAGENLTTTEDSIVATTGIPQIDGTLYSGMYCIDLVPKQDSLTKHPTSGVDTWLWAVQASFSNDVDLRNNFTDPLLRPTIVNKNTVTQVVPQYYDVVTGALLVNSVNEPIVLKRKIEIPVLTYTRFESAPFSDSTLITYSGSTNNAAFGPYPAGTGYMRINAPEVTIKNTQYAKVTYTLMFLIDPVTPTAVDTMKAPVTNTGSKYVNKFGFHDTRDPYGNATQFNLNLNGTLRLPTLAPLTTLVNQAVPQNWGALSL